MTVKTSILAINGGKPVRTQPMPSRSVLGLEERALVTALFDEAIQSGEGIGYNGRYEVAYEQSFADLMGGGYADGVNSGTNALFVALGALGLDALSEVVVPAITDPGGIMPVLFAGCVPVIADTDRRCYNTSAQEIERVLTSRTRAIVVAHIAGEPADMDPIIKLAREKALYLIEDCAQAHAAYYKGKILGSLGDIAVFSTMFSKHHCTGAQGGVVYTNNEDLYWRVKRFSDRGKPFNIQESANVVAGLNCNLNDFAAAIGTVQLQKLRDVVQRRCKVADAIYAGLEDCLTVSKPWLATGAIPSYWFMRFRIDLDKISVGKVEFCDALIQEGIPVRYHYRYIPCEMQWFKEQSVFGSSQFPWQCSDYRGERNPQPKIENAIYATDTHFNLNIHENYTEQDVSDVLEAIRKVEQAYLL